MLAEAAPSVELPAAETEVSPVLDTVVPSDRVTVDPRASRGVVGSCGSGVVGRGAAGGSGEVGGGSGA